MLRFVGGVAVVLVVLLGLGFYLGWFQFSTTESGNRTDVKISVDKEKIEKDAEKARDKVEQVGHEVKEGATKLLDKKKE